MTEFEFSILPDTGYYCTVQFTLALTVYFMLSILFQHAILEQESLPDNGDISGSDIKKDDYRIDETAVA